jgi:hypothetical protein
MKSLMVMTYEEDVFIRTMSEDTAHANISLCTSNNGGNSSLTPFF